MPIHYPISNTQRPELFRAKDAKQCLALFPEYEEALRRKLLLAIHDPDIEAGDVALLQASMERNLFALQRRLALMSEDGRAIHAENIEQLLGKLQEDIELLL